MKVKRYGNIAIVLMMLAAAACGTRKEKIGDTSVAPHHNITEEMAERRVCGGVKATETSAPGDMDARGVTSGEVFTGNYFEEFNDSNYRQYAYAETLGIEPITKLEDAYFVNRPLIHIQSNEYYEVDELTHSVPFLIPSAAQLLEDIGKEFKSRLKNKGVEGYKIKVTSVLRTPQSVKSLRRVNRNATDSSTHKFATTFDISWAKFPSRNPKGGISESEMKYVLGETLYGMRQAGRCLVKYERKSPCFHITVTE